MKFIIVLFFSLSALTVSAQGVLDGFIDQPKTKSLAVSVSGENSEIYFLGSGEDLEFGVQNSIVSIYYKQQINKWLGVSANIPLINWTPQDGSVFLKTGKQFQLSKSWSVNGVLGIGGTHPLVNYNTEASTAIGQQIRAFHLRALTQITYKNQLFLNGRIGQNIVASPTPNSTVYSIKLGYYKNKWYADLWYENHMAQGGKDYRGVGDLAADNFRELGFSLERIGGVVYHQTKEKLGLFIGFGHTLGGRNAFKTSRISAGAVWKF